MSERMVPPRFGIPSDSDYDYVKTQKWIFTLPDSALQRIAHGLHDIGDQVLRRQLEEEWWERHAKRLDDWPTIELAVPVAIKAIMFCGQMGRGRDDLTLLAAGPFDPNHQPRRMLPFREDGDSDDDEAEYWIECMCGWKESQGPEPQLHRVGDWWWPVVTHWDCADLAQPSLLLCKRATSPHDVAHAPKNYVTRVDLSDEVFSEECHIPAGNRTPDHLFTKCICGSRPYWPENFQLVPATEEHLSHLNYVEAQSNNRS